MGADPSRPGPHAPTPAQTSPVLPGQSAFTAIAVGTWQLPESEHTWNRVAP